MIMEGIGVAGGSGRTIVMLAGLCPAVVPSSSRPSSCATGVVSLALLA